MTTDPNNLSRETLIKYFHLPINEAAKQLGMCATILKKICRSYDIQRWPHRKIKSIDSMIESLQEVMDNNTSNQPININLTMDDLLRKKQYIIDNPNEPYKSIISKYTINSFNAKIQKAKEERNISNTGNITTGNSSFIMPSSLMISTKPAKTIVKQTPKRFVPKIQKQSPFSLKNSIDKMEDAASSLVEFSSNVIPSYARTYNSTKLTLPPIYNKQTQTKTMPNITNKQESIPTFQQFLSGISAAFSYSRAPIEQSVASVIPAMLKLSTDDISVLQ